MKMKLVVVLCEGAHDVAFLSRVLKTDHFSICSTKIKEMPPKLGSIIKGRLEKLNINDLAFNDIRPEIPSIIMNKDSEGLYVMMHALGGKDNVEMAKKIIAGYNLLLPETDHKAEARLVDYLAFVHIIDANGAKIHENEEIFKKVFANLCRDIHERKVGHNEIVRYRSGAGLGCFIISADGQKGKLEDIIIPLMEKDNEIVFADACQYFEKHCENNNKVPKVDKGKAIVGITGQLCKPGCSNVVVIRESPYLTDDKIKADEKCREIILFFSRLLTP